MILQVKRMEIPINIPQNTEGMKKSIINGLYEKANYDHQIVPQIRDCTQMWVKEPKFDEMVNSEVKEYLLKYDEAESDKRQDTRWKMFEYYNGRFAQHIDFPEQRETQTQVATQILLPPRKLCDYQGGILKVKENDRTIEIGPDQGLWTHVILPIGLLHEVTPVIGKRISFVRLIFVEKKYGRNYIVNIPTESMNKVLPVVIS